MPENEKIVSWVNDYVNRISLSDDGMQNTTDDGVQNTTHLKDFVTTLRDPASFKEEEKGGYIAKILNPPAKPTESNKDIDVSNANTSHVANVEKPSSSHVVNATNCGWMSCIR